MATAHSASLWVWMPTSTRSPSASTTAAVASATCAGQAGAVGVAEGDVLGAGLGRGPQALERVAGVVALGVEEVLGVVDDALALRRGRRRPSRRSSPGSPRGETLVTFSRCSPQVLPTRVHTGAKQPTSVAQRRVVLGARRRAGGSCRRRRSSALLELDLGEQLEQLRLLRVRAREAGLDEVDAEPVERAGPRAPSRRPRATCPGPACRRAGSCRRAVPVSQSMPFWFEGTSEGRARAQAARPRAARRPRRR